jgi:TetR/AcrR family transcriptional regulator
MEVLATDTEQLIKDTAKKVFFVDGNIHATTQDIADAAGINRASIHYYYRSRKILFDKVFEEALIEMRSKLESIASASVPIKEKTEKFVDFFMERSMQHPYLELFIITEHNSDPSLPLKIMPKEGHADKMKYLEAEIAREVKAGNMKPIKPEHFVVTMMSLCSFPFLGKSIIESIFDLDQQAYAKFIKERKQVVMQLLFLDA